MTSIEDTGLHFIVARLSDDNWHHLAGPSTLASLNRVLTGWQERYSTARIVTAALEPSGEGVGAEAVAWLALAGENKSRCLCWTEGVALSEAGGDRSRIQPLYAQPLSGMEGVRKSIDRKALEAATVEYLAHRGEQPRSVKKGGYELWEAHAPAMAAALETFLSTPVSAASPEGEATVPEGFVLVPVEPVMGMFAALTASWPKDDVSKIMTAKWAAGSFREDYQAMLAASPSATQEKNRG